MQFTLQSLMIAFVVVASAIGAFGAWGIAVAAVLIIVAVIVRSPIKWTDDIPLSAIFAVICISVLLMIFYLPHVGSSPGGPELICQSNLKQICLALQNYEARNGTLPPAYIVGPDGKPWHSWRVLILPYLDRRDLFDAYKFDEPWNGPNNIKLAPCMPSVFHCPSDSDANTRCITSYVAVVGPDTLWPERGSVSTNNMPDGACMTILIVEKANSGINWMEPRDLPFEQVSKDNPSTCPDLFAPHGRKGGVHYEWAGWSMVAFADSHIAVMSSDYLSENLKAMLTRNGGEAVDPDRDYGPAFDPNYIKPLSFADFSRISNIAILFLSTVLLLFRPRRRKKRTVVKEDGD
jgi:hypothetical protein